MNISRSKYPNLVSIIVSDLFLHAKLPLFLLMLVLISGISVVIITYKTRELIGFHERIILKKDALEVENRHLMLEEKVLGDFLRVETIALKKLNMRYVDFHEGDVIYFYNQCE